MSEISKQVNRRRSLLLTSVAISVGLHGLGLYFLATQPVTLHHSLRSLFGISIPAPEYLDSAEELQAKKNTILEEVFDQVVVFSSHLQQPFDLVELPRGIAIAPDEEMAPELSFEHRVQSDLFIDDFICTSDANWDAFTPQDLIACSSDSVPLFVPTLAIPSASIRSFDLEYTALPLDQEAYIIDPLEISSFVCSASEESEGNTARMQESLMAHSFPASILKEGDDKILEIDTTLAAHKTQERVPFLSYPPLSALHAPRIRITDNSSDFSDYFPESLAATSEWNDDFDLNITFLPNPEGRGYIFSLALEPNFDISQYSLKHDVIFVIDHSVRKHRFDVFKRAVIKALSCLQQGDSFNIYIIDKKMTRLHTKSLPVSQKTLRAAEHFLEKQAENALFSKGDIYASLEKILSELQGVHCIHSAIVVTDGVSHTSSKKQSQVLKDWMEKNNGKLSVYTAAVGQKNDLLMLDLLSSISGGKLLWSDTHSAFPRKLAKLVLDLRDPIASDLVIDATPIHSDTKISLAPSFFQPPVLFSHQPYVIVGSIDEPGPFDLMIQGRHGDQWIAIKKTVSFIEGSKGDRSLINQWMSQKALRPYTKFLNDGKLAYLKEAKEIFKKSRSEVAFE